MSGEVRDLAVPCTRDVEPGLRRKRLAAARGYAHGSLPRVAILLGHWDGGTIVGGSGRRQ